MVEVLMIKDGGFAYEDSHLAFMQMFSGRYNRGCLYSFIEKTLLVGFSTYLFSSTKLSLK